MCDGCEFFSTTLFNYMHLVAIELFWETDLSSCFRYYFAFAFDQHLFAPVSAEDSMTSSAPYYLVENEIVALAFERLSSYEENDQKKRCKCRKAGKLFSQRCQSRFYLFRISN